MTQAARLEHRTARTASTMVAAMLAIAAPLGAQAAVPGADVNAATDGGGQRSPLWFGSAYTLPRGARGISFQQAFSHERDRSAQAPPGLTTYTREQFASTVSAYWGTRDWLTLGGSLELNSTRNQIASPDPDNPPFGGLFFEDSDFGIGQLRAFGRVRLARSATGATQVAVNASLGTLPTQVGYNGHRSDASLGLALAQRIGPLSLHLAPSLEGRDNDGSFAQVAGAVVFPLLPRVSASIEGVVTSNRAGDWNRAPVDPLSEIGGGLRFDFKRVKVDLGLRQSTSGGERDQSRRARIVLGTHVKF